jgi:TRAP-type uncharacterized transport system fused permease subunit
VLYGGQIMPPVMGVSAFIMAGITGIPYSHIALSAFLPALVYYGYLGISIDIRALKRNMPKEEFSISDVKESAKKHAYLVIPFILLIYSHPWEILLQLERSIIMSPSLLVVRKYCIMGRT